MNTGHPSTRVGPLTRPVNSASGNRALHARVTSWDVHGIKLLVISSERGVARTVRTGRLLQLTTQNVVVLETKTRRSKRACVVTKSDFIELIG